MQRKVVVVTGMSGSGKSTVAHTLEDAGFFCVDNLPVDLLPKLLELVSSRTGELTRLALVIDLRQRKFFPRYSAIFNSLELSGTSLEILFLDARDDVLVRRYSERGDSIHWPQRETLSTESKGSASNWWK